MLAKVASATIVGIDAVEVGVEVDISAGLPGMAVVGLPDTAVQESKERVKAAIKNTGYVFPLRKIVVNLTPADLRKEGPSFDLPISLGVLAATEQVQVPADLLFLGELSLDGSLRGVSGVLPIAATARQLGKRGVVVPKDNWAEAKVVGEIAVYAFSHLGEVLQFLQDPASYQEPIYQQPEQAVVNTPSYDLREVKGQSHARRALEIAAAGGHNLIFVGPPGAGKTLLARCLPSILPPMTPEEALETTRIYSVAGLLQGKGLITD